jgi:RNA-directed DNA polymerase
MRLLSVRRLAQLLNCSVARLREIADEIDCDVNSHYRFHSERKPGSDIARHYMVPTHELKEIHKKIKSNVLTLFPISGVAHGGIRGRSPRSNAAKHLGQRWLVTLDVKSFFPNVRHYIVHDMFSKEMGCGREVAWLLTRLTTLNAQLPQGAPSSTAVANLVLTLAVDEHVAALAQKNGSFSTRFVDDIALSGNDPQSLIDPTVRALSRKRLPIWRKSAKYQSRPKFKITPNSRRQEVTGLVVNAASGPSVPKRYRDGVRAAIFQLRNIADVEERRLAERSIRGRIAYVGTCNPGPAAKLAALLARQCEVGMYGGLA